MNQFRETYDLFEQLFKQYPNSIYNIMSIHHISFLLDNGKNNITDIKNKKLKLRTKALSLLKDKFPNNRQALVETKWLLIGTPQEEKRTFIERASSEIKSEEFVESLKGLINKEMPADLIIEKVKNNIIAPPSSEDEVFEFFVVSEKPVLLHKKSPEYPLAAKEKLIEGKVVVSIIIDENGDVIEAIIKKSIPLLDESCIDAAKSLKFKPGKHNGKLVKVKMTLPYRFNL